MNRFVKLSLIAGAGASMAACTRIETGEAAKIQAQGIANFKGQTLVIGACTNVNVGNK